MDSPQALKDMLQRDIKEKNTMTRRFNLVLVLGGLLFLVCVFGIYSTLVNRSYNRQSIEETLRNRKLNEESIKLNRENKELNVRMLHMIDSLKTRKP